jgi:hypothetical protein
MGLSMMRGMSGPSHPPQAVLSVIRMNVIHAGKKKEKKRKLVVLAISNYNTWKNAPPAVGFMLFRLG